MGEFNNGQFLMVYYFSLYDSATVTEKAHNKAHKPSDLEERPSSATSGTDTSSDSLEDSDCTSCVWTSAPAWAPGSHTTETGTQQSGQAMQVIMGCAE